MAKRRGATARDPKYRRLPAQGDTYRNFNPDNDMRTGGKNPENIAKAGERLAARTPTERVSPGIYRSISGGLVTQQGRPIQQQTQQVTGEMPQQNPWWQNAANNMTGQADGMANQTGMFPNQYDDKMYRYPLGTNMQDAMYRVPNLPQMPQASANQGGQYRLSPGVYGTREQAMNQYNQQLQQMTMPQVRKG